MVSHLCPPGLCSSEEQVAQELFIQQMQKLFIQQMQKLVSARPVCGVPVIGGLYEAMSETTRTAFLPEHPTLAFHERQTPWQRLDILTHAFLDDLRHLAASSNQPPERQGMRIVLLLDEVSPANRERLTWVRTQVLPAVQDMQVVLILAGSEPLDQAFSTEPQQITRLTLHALSEAETRAFLAHEGITDPVQVAPLWHKTAGLPLALRLLAAVPASWLEAQEDAITTGLRWIEQQGLTSRYLVRYGALFFRAFGSQDLAVCPMVSAQDCIQWYRHLIGLPFIHPSAITGESASHPLMQRQVLWRFAAEAGGAYRHARQAVAQYYQCRLERLRKQEGARIMESAAGQHLVLALLGQWLWLADEVRPGRAIEVCLQAVEQAGDIVPLTSWLRAWVQAGAADARPAPGSHLAQLLLVYSEAELEHPAFLEATGELLKLIGQPADVLPVLQARRPWAGTPVRDAAPSGSLQALAAGRCGATGVLSAAPASLAASSGATLAGAMSMHEVRLPQGG